MAAAAIKTPARPVRPLFRDRVGRLSGKRRTRTLAPGRATSCWLGFGTDRHDTSDVHHTLFLTECTRGPAVEAQHVVDAVLVDASGALVEAWGELNEVVYPRSAIKSIQVLLLFETMRRRRDRSGGCRDRDRLQLLQRPTGARQGRPVLAHPVRPNRGRSLVRRAPALARAERPRARPGGARPERRSQHVLGQARGLPGHGGDAGRADCRLRRA